MQNLYSIYKTACYHYTDVDLNRSNCNTLSPPSTTVVQSTIYYRRLHNSNYHQYDQFHMSHALTHKCMFKSIYACDFQDCVFPIDISFIFKRNPLIIVHKMYHSKLLFSIGSRYQCTKLQVKVLELKVLHENGKYASNTKTPHAPPYLPNRPHQLQLL